ncbi:MAG: hypothetical protein KGQ60_00675 [Planctomycetes bacterium]|nr:hypothetical protein [Planctomycetota bacterium]
MSLRLQKIMRRLLIVALFGSVILIADSPHVCAQYGTNFFYINPQTGFCYSQQTGIGRNSAYGGFSYGNNRHSYSAGSGYFGRNYYNGNFYSNHNHTYSQGALYGPRYHYGSTIYSANPVLPPPLVRRRAPGSVSPAAGLTGP